MSLNRFNGIPVADFHVHVFPDDVASRALDTLLSAYGVEPVTDGTVSGLLAHMRASGVRWSIIQPVATKPSQVRSINDWAAAHTEPGVVSFGAVHPDSADPAGDVDYIISRGLPGIKIQANWQDVYVDEPRMYPIYEAAQGRLIVLFHSGDELTPFDELRATPERIARVHADFPRLTIVAAHMGGYRVWDDVERHLLGRDVYFDTSACFPNDLPDDRFMDMIRRHGPERIVFATDSPFGDATKDMPRLARMGLSDDELEMIFHGNARRLLGHRLA